MESCLSNYLTKIARSRKFPGYKEKHTQA